MLREVLKAVEASAGGTDLRTLSRDLGIERNALEGMIAYWVRKGRLVDSASRSEHAGAETETCASCGPRACAGADTCPFVVVAPRTVSMPVGSRDDRERPAERDESPSEDSEEATG